MLTFPLSPMSGTLPVAPGAPGSKRRSGLPDATSLTLLAGVRAHEPEAWRRLVHLYGPLVYHWCRCRRLQARDAEDIVQEVFLAVARRVTDFRREREGDSFRGWLWTITRHKLGDWIRRRRAPEQPVGGSDGQLQLREALDRLAEGHTRDADPAETGGLYERALDLIRGEFAERSWQAFWRVVVEGQDPADVAVALRITRNAVYVAKSRILCRLRAVLGDKPSPPSS